MPEEFSLEGFSLKELITTWLEVTSDRKIPLGLEVEEALRRAEDILPRLRSGKIRPADLEFDDEFKDVLHALIALVSESVYKTPEERAADAWAVHAFIRGVWHEADEIGEKKMLLKDCISIAENPGSPRSVLSPLEIERPEPPPWTPDAPAPDPSMEPARAAFVHNLPLLHETLVAGYGLTEPQAIALEKELYDWFLRFRRREARGTGRDRLVLMTLCCDWAEKQTQRKGSLQRGVAVGRRDSALPGKLVRFRRGLGARTKRRG